mgnify:CR=1 FL=1
MKDFKASKVVFNLPEQLEPNTSYWVRSGEGFDLYLSDVTGKIAHKLNLVTESQIIELSNSIALSIREDMSLANTNALPTITRMNQVLTTTSLDGVPLAEWRDKGLVPDESSEISDLNMYISGDTLTIPLGKYLPINLHNIMNILETGGNNGPITFKITVDGKVVEGILDDNLIYSLFFEGEQTDSTFYMPYNDRFSVFSNLNAFKLKPVDVVVSKFSPLGQVRFYSANFDKFSQFNLTSGFQPISTKYRKTKETEIIIEKNSENSLVDVLLKGSGVTKPINKIVFTSDIELNPFWIPAGTLSEDNKVLTLNPGEFLPVISNYAQLEITGPQMDSESITTYNLIRWGDANPVLHRYLSISPEIYAGEITPLTKIKDGLKGPVLSVTSQNNKYYIGTISSEQNAVANRASSIGSSFSLVEDQIVYSKDDISNSGVDTFFNYLKKNVPLPETVEKIIFKSNIIWSGVPLPVEPVVVTQPIAFDNVNLETTGDRITFDLPEEASSSLVLTLDIQEINLNANQYALKRNIFDFTKIEDTWNYTNTYSNYMTINPIIEGNKVSILVKELVIPCKIISSSADNILGYSKAEEYRIDFPASDDTFINIFNASLNNEELKIYSSRDTKLTGDLKESVTIVWDEFLDNSAIELRRGTLLADGTISLLDYMSCKLVPAASDNTSLVFIESSSFRGGQYIVGPLIDIGDVITFFKDGDIYSINNETKQITTSIKFPTEDGKRSALDTDKLQVTLTTYAETTYPKTVSFKAI